jgi:hypothetical protein
MNETTIDMTPTWRDLLPAMLALMEQRKLPALTRSDVRREFARMAQAADKWNEYCAKQNPPPPIVGMNLDEQDHARAVVVLQNRMTVPEPMVGDFVLFEGEPPTRITHDWGGEFQTTPRGTDATDHHGFFIYENGQASYSGSLDPCVARADLEAVDELRACMFWFFRHREARAHNGVYFSAPVRVWRYTG